MSLSSIILICVASVLLYVAFDHIRYVRRREKEDDDLNFVDWSNKISKQDMPNDGSLSQQVSNPSYYEKTILDNPAMQDKSEFTGYKIEVYSSNVKTEDFIIINMELQELVPLGELVDILAKETIVFGYKNLFHRYEINEKEKIKNLIFSVANAKKPGEFSLENLSQPIKSLIFFMDRRRCANPMKYFDTMIKSATIVANRLNGQLFDNEKNSLTNQKINYIKDTIRHSIVRS